VTFFLEYYSFSNLGVSILACELDYLFLSLPASFKLSYWALPCIGTFLKPPITLCLYIRDLQSLALYLVYALP